MKYACILLLLAGCAWGRRERVKAIEEKPTINDSTLAVKVAPTRPVVRPVRHSFVRQDTSRTVRWPDDHPYKLILFYRRTDTNGNIIPEPEVRLQYEQFNADTACGYKDLRERLDRKESDYWIAGDTLYVNIPFLRKFNPAPSDDYAYMLRFRLRLEDFFDPSKNSGWIYARKALNLYRADRAVGVPSKPVLIEVH